MKKVFLLIVVSALLTALGFAQTPAANSNPDQINIKGCLGGSDGHYTVAEDNTGQIFTITTSSADLQPHLGQNVKLIGHKTGGAADNSLVVTEVDMISEHCTAAAAAPAAIVSTPSETPSTPPTAAAAPTTAPVTSAATPDETVSTPTTAAPATTTSGTPSETPSTPATAAAAPTTTPAAIVSTPGEAVSAPAAAVQTTRPSPRARKPSVTPAAPAETVNTPAAATPAAATPAAATPAAAALAAPVDAPSETASSTPVEAPTKPATSARGGSLWMLASLVVVVLLMSALVPLFNRWRKRKLLEQTSAQNLSFTNEPSSDQVKSDAPARRKAA